MNTRDTTEQPSVTAPAARAADRVVVAVFLLACTLPFAIWLVTPFQPISVIENRARTAAPVRPATFAEALAFPQAFEKYWNDNFGLRSPLVQLNARQRIALGASPSGDVILGKDGFLFLAANASIRVWRGIAPFSEQELLAWKTALVRRRDYLAARGIKYYFSIAPNKEAIYPELLPSEQVKVGPTRLDQLITYLGDDFEIIDLRDKLPPKSQGKLYFKTDTHWTDLGLVAAYNELSRRLVKDFPRITPRTAADFRSVNAPPYIGDLSAMVGLGGSLSEERMSIEVVGGYRSKLISGGEGRNGGANSVVETAHADWPRALVLHDSFYLPPEQRFAPPEDYETPLRMNRLLGELFSHSRYEWRRDVPKDVIDSEKPDVVIQSFVERQLFYPPEGAL